VTHGLHSAERVVFDKEITRIYIYLGVEEDAGTKIAEWDYRGVSWQRTYLTRRVISEDNISKTRGKLGG